MTSQRIAPRPTATAALVFITLILPALLAGDEPPRLPAKDLRGLAPCTVVRVVTGDTLIVRIDHEGRRLALLGTKAPALSQPSGHDARRYLENLLRGEQVYVDFAAKPTQRDSFGRTPAMLYRVPDGLCINLEVIRQGWADAATRANDNSAAGRANDHSAAGKVGPSLPGLMEEQAATFEFFAKRAKESAKGRWANPADATAASATDATVDANDANMEDAADAAHADAGTPTSAPVERGTPPATAPTTAPTGTVAAGRSGDGNAAPTSADETIVYITASGKKYHKPDCPHLRKSAQPVTLKEAKARGYTPCATCKPPE